MTYLLHNIGDLKHPSYNTREEIQNADSLLTFDGIYTNVWENRDILKDTKAIFFVMGNFIGGDNLFDDGAPMYEEYCDMEQLGELLVISNGKIGWHTKTHRDLTTLSDEELADELDCPWDGVMDIAYPYGKFDDRVIEAAKKAGFERGWSVDKGDNSDFQLRRKYL